MENAQEKKKERQREYFGERFRSRETKKGRTEEDKVRGC